MANQQPNIDLTNPIFHDEELAREHLESVRWPDGVICPHCGCYEHIMKLKGKATRPGVYKCGDCRKQFTVTVGTVFERSNIPLNKWVMATHLVCASKKGVSAHQLHRMLGITYKSAWFMMHRIREAMRETRFDQLGGEGRYVEVDETYITKTSRVKGKKNAYYQEKVVTLVERDGRARSFHVPRVTINNVVPILNDQIKEDSALITDEAGIYTKAGKRFAGHGTVNHSIGEYVKGTIHTNTIEGFFSIFKRGLHGIYQHCSKEHLKRYLAEYDFRYTYRQKLGFSDSERANIALKGIEGKRLTYNPINQKQDLPFPVGI